MRTPIALVMSLSLCAVAFACDDASSPFRPSPSLDVNDNATLGGHHFGRFVAMGTSQTAASVSAGLFAESQQQAWPAQLAQMANVGFTEPLLDEFGCPAPWVAPLELELRANGDARNNATSCSPLLDGVELPTQNVAIPNVLTSEALFTTPEIAAALNATVGNLYSRILPPGQTQVSAMRAQHPSYVAVEFGGVEVISSVRLGLATPLVSFADWAPLYDMVIAAVKAEGARAVLVSFPDDMASWPGLRSGAELYADRDAFTARYITLSEACGAADAGNMVYVARKVFQVFAAAKAARAAGSPAPVLTCRNVPGTQDGVHSPAELIAVNAAWAQVNDYIRATATANGFAQFSLDDLFRRPDFKPPFSLEGILTSSEPFGPYMGLDELHPNAAGERILARAAAQALNEAYGLHIPWRRRLGDG